MRTRKRERQGPSGSHGRQGLLRLYDACISNAEDLLTEAETLFERQHYARAYALAYTSLEEIGKAHIVADFWTGVVSEEEFYEAFRNHKLKAAYIQRLVWPRFR